MKSNTLFLLALGSLLFAPIAANADVYFTNTNSGNIAYVTMYNNIHCDSGYDTNFSCDHYINTGGGLSFADGPEGGNCWHTYTISTISYIPTPSMSVTGSTIKTGVGPSVTVTLSIGGTADMAYVELGTSNSSRFTVTAVSKDVSNRTVTITVVGVAATPTSSPSGDATIKGLFHGVALCSGPNVVVLVPTTQSQVADTLSYWGNTSSGTSTIHLQTLVSRYSFITIKDQFNVTLSSLWNGSYKLDEEFSNLAGSLASELPTGRGPIYKPDHYLTNGVQLDECSHFVAIDVPSSALPGWNPTDWTNGGYFFSYFGASGYNLIQANYGSSTNHMIGDQKLWVWNTEITNQIRRDVGITGTSVPTISVSF